jgi:phosphatidylglycerophosphate synthase
VNSLQGVFRDHTADPNVTAACLKEEIIVRAVLAIPGLETLRRHAGQDQRDAAKVLMRKVVGVPLLTRVIATAAQAGVNSVLVIWPEGLSTAILKSLAESSLIKDVRVDQLVWPHAFDPRRTAHWTAIAGRLGDEFLWLPWNWMTHKRALTEPPPLRVRPVTWERPVLLNTRAVHYDASFRVSSARQTQGVSVISRKTVSDAERFLVAHSGKPADGIFSEFNRRLCRPVVRLLAHTRLTPNVLTLAGLLVAIVAALLFARGSYVYYLAGASLFLVSGLFDEMDGMLARLKFQESAFGTWLEGLVDKITYLAVFTGIVVGLHREYGSWPLKCGIALIIGCILSVLVFARQREFATSQLLEAYSSNAISKIARKIHIWARKGIFVHYLLLFAFVGALPIFLWVAAIGSNLTWIGALHFARRFHGPPIQVTEDIRTAA